MSQLYAVNDIYPTIQGEGVQTGIPMVLLRLHGCAVGCHFCDTKETWYRNDEHQRPLIEDVVGTSPLYTLKEGRVIARHIEFCYRHIAWVMLTGGEPAEQPLFPLVEHLHAQGFKVALETSGTADGHLDADFDWVVVSPKWGNPNTIPVRPDVLAKADEIKVVVGKQSDIDRLDTELERIYFEKEPTICLQPMSMNPRATALCVETCLHKGWRLSIQTHRLINQR